jgi:hypothetical protein
VPCHHVGGGGGQVQNGFHHILRPGQPIKEDVPKDVIPELLDIFDTNSLWGELNVQKRQLCVKGILGVCPDFVAKIGLHKNSFGIRVLT